MTLSTRAVTRLDEWSITAVEPVPDHAGVWWARRGDDYVVVKTGDVDDRRREARALSAFGNRAARVIAHDDELGLLVVERMILGSDIRPLARQDDDAATVAIATLAGHLHDGQAPHAPLPDLAGIGAAFEFRDDPRLPRRVVDAAEAVFADLVGDRTSTVVLHGDLHHMNVLDHGGIWHAIDPHGWVGDPAFEAAAMLANPRGMQESGDARGMDGTDLAHRVRRRAEIYAEVLGQNRERVRAWGFVGCVIAELWMIESHDLVHGAPLAVAESLLAQGV